MWYHFIEGGTWDVAEAEGGFAGISGEGGDGGVEELFQDKSVRKKEASTDEAALYEQIGRLKVELDLVKKSCPFRLTSGGV